LEIRSPVFERIKRQIYIRSPRHVADHAVTARQLVTRTTRYISQLDLEQRFYMLENNSIANFDGFFDPVYFPLRQMTVHPEASERLRRQMSQASHNSSSSNNPLSASVNQAGQRAILAAKARLRIIEGHDLKRAAKQLRDATRSLELAEKIAAHRARPVATSVFSVGNSGTDATRASREEEKKIVHDHYCACNRLDSTDCYADRKVFFRIMRDENSTEAEFIHGGNATARTVQYLDGLRGDHTMRSKSLQQYITSSKRSVAMRNENLDTQEQEKRELFLRIETLSQASKPGAVEDENDALAAMHGSKPAALVRFLQTVTAKGEQVIVFSYWHDTLKLIGHTLSRCGLRSVFCCGHGAAMALALQEFTTNASPILLLSAKSKASGANLQCATHVVLLDPAGSSAEHGSTLEEQAVGRAVRMGQLKPTTVTRFCVTGTIEEDLFSEIDSAAVSAKKGSSDNYVITDFDSKAAAVPKRVAKTIKTTQEEEDDDINDIEITDTVSPGERLRRTFQEAQENGNVISLDDDNDDKAFTTPFTSSEEEEKEDDKDDDDVKVTDTVSPNERIRRKFQNAQENGNIICLDPDGDKEQRDPNIKLEPITDGKRLHQDAKRESKRMRREQQEDSQASVQPDHATFTPAPPGSAVASVSSGSSVGCTPDSDQGNIDKSGFSGVRDLLRRLDLSEYTRNFWDCGFDNLEALYQSSHDLTTMASIFVRVGFKPYHAARFHGGLSKEAAAHTVAASMPADPESSWI
jgi:Helicase conserved C-terminal domain